VQGKSLYFFCRPPPADERNGNFHWFPPGRWKINEISSRRTEDKKISIVLLKSQYGGMGMAVGLLKLTCRTTLRLPFRMSAVIVNETDDWRRQLTARAFS
jgi:hypothetical protein